MSLRIPPLASLLMLAACSGSSPPPPPRPPAAAPPAPVAPSAPTAAATATPPPPPSRFHVMARVEGAGPLSVLAPAGGLFLTDGAAVMAIRDGVLVRDDAMTRGLDLSFAWFASIDGRWPDSAYATLSVAIGRTGAAVVNHWEGSAWKPTHQLPQSWGFAGISTWDKGRLLGLAIKTLPTGGPRDGYEFQVLAGPHGGPLPRLTLPRAGCRSEFEVNAAVAPGAFLALPSGQVIVAGHDCDDHAAVEWFEPGATRGTQAMLTPAACHGVVTIDGTRPDDVVVGLKCYVDTTAERHAHLEPRLFRFDGRAFAPISYPGAEISALQSTPGGIWVLDGATLRHRPTGGDWSEVSLPPGLDGVTHFHVSADGEVWATSGGAVLSTRPAPAEVAQIQWPARGVQLARGSFARPRAATKICESIYALLFSFNQVTPDDYDFPLTRKALAGHEELAGIRLVVTRDHGKKYFGAFAPSYDVGQKLLSLIQKGVPDAQPELLCVKPEVVRELAIDFTTGDVKRRDPVARPSSP